MLHDALPIKKGLNEVFFILLNQLSTIDEILRYRIKVFNGNLQILNTKH